MLTPLHGVHSRIKLYTVLQIVKTFPLWDFLNITLVCVFFFGEDFVASLIKIVTEMLGNLGIDLVVGPVQLFLLYRYVAGSRYNEF